MGEFGREIKRVDEIKEERLNVQMRIGEKVWAHLQNKKCNKFNGGNEKYFVAIQVST